MTLTFRVFSEKCFGWNVGLKKYLPELPLKENPLCVSSLENGQDTEEKRILKEMRCVYMLLTIILKTVLRGICRAPHDLKVSQFFNSQGITRLVNDFLANLGICMTKLEHYNHEMIHVDSREDKNLLPPGMFPIAVAWDNNGVRPTMDVTPGAPYVAFIGATAVGISSENAELPRLAVRDKFRNYTQVSEEMVIHGLDRDNDKSTFEGFETNLLEASWNAWTGVKSQPQTPTCVEAEIRNVSFAQLALKRFEWDSNYLIQGVQVMEMPVRLE